MKHLCKLILVITISLIFISCGGNQSKEEKTVTESSQAVDSTNQSPKTETTLEVNDTVAIKTLTKEILTSLKNKNYESFAGYFHPDLGVRFSPYAYVDTVKDVHLSAGEFTQAINSRKKLTWGEADGTGDPIRLTIPEYLNYYGNFLDAKKTAVNKMIGVGNSVNNLEEIYPDALYTENFNTGKHEMAWSALRLVFKKETGQFYLIAIVHDQWTI
jgi:hypothetical protein